MRRQLTWTMCFLAIVAVVVVVLVLVVGGGRVSYPWKRLLQNLSLSHSAPAPHRTTPGQATSLHPARLDSMVAVSFRRRSQEPSNQPKADDEALKVSYNNTINNNSQLPTTESQKQDDIGLGL